MRQLSVLVVLLSLFVVTPCRADVPVELISWNRDAAWGFFYEPFVYPTVQVTVWRLDTEPATFVSHAAERILPGNTWEALFYPSLLPEGVPLRLHLSISEGEYGYIMSWDGTF